MILSILAVNRRGSEPDLVRTKNPMLALTSVLARLYRQPLPSAALERLATADLADAAWTLATARVRLGRMLAEAGRPREAEPPLRAALEWLDRAGTDTPRRAEATCVLARARILLGGDPAAEQGLRECLPVYRAWGLAESEVVEALERLDGGPAVSSRANGGPL